jgi:hypothetical protein
LIIASYTEETTDLVNGRRWFLVQYFLNFTGINGYTVTGDGMSQKFNGIQPKLTFGEFGVQVVVP